MNCLKNEWRVSSAALFGTGLFLLLPTTGSAQEWHAEEKIALLTDAKLTEFSLQGTFVKPPSRGSIAAPVLVVKCAHGKGSNPGKYLSSFVLAGAVLNAESAAYRLDDGKPQPSLDWTLSSNTEGAFFGELDLTNMLYGHLLKHKAHPSKPVHKLLIVIDEFGAGGIAMQFDMPDPKPVGEACGIVKATGAAVLGTQPVPAPMPPPVQPTTSAPSNPYLEGLQSNIEASKSSAARAASIAILGHEPTPQELAELVKNGQASRCGIVTVPPGAEIKVDGNKAGVSPLALVLLKLGDTPRIITIKMSGYKVFEKNVVPDGKVIPIGVTLEKQ